MREDRERRDSGHGSPMPAAPRPDGASGSSGESAFSRTIVAKRESPIGGKD